MAQSAGRRQPKWMDACTFSRNKTWARRLAMPEKDAKAQQPRGYAVVSPVGSIPKPYRKRPRLPYPATNQSSRERELSARASNNMHVEADALGDEKSVGHACGSERKPQPEEAIAPRCLRSPRQGCLAARVYSSTRSSRSLGSRVRVRAGSIRGTPGCD